MSNPNFTSVKYVGVRKWSELKNRPPGNYFGSLTRIQPPAPTERTSDAFLDFENTGVPYHVDFFNLPNVLQTALKNVHPELKLSRVYAAGNRMLFEDNAKYHGRFFHENRRTGTNPFFFALELAGISVSAVPRRRYRCVGCDPLGPPPTSQPGDIDRQDKYTRTKDLADALIIRDMISLPLTHPPPGYVILISDDKDFASSLDFLSERGYTIFLAEVSRAVASLQRNALLVWDWSSLMAGRQPRLARF